MRARLEADRHSPGEYTLVVDGTPQSHVSVGDPSYLSFEYTRRMGHVIDLVAGEGDPISAVHLGAGALTLPRYVDHTRPGSRQQVVEYDSELINFVREHLPLPRGASIRVRHGDAREVVGRLPAGLHGAVDVLVVDMFVGAQTPRHVSSLQFYEMLPHLLSGRGVVLVNIADGSDQRFVRGQLATLAQVFPHLWLIADPQILKGRRFGNYVAIASSAEHDWDGLPRRLASDPTPSRLMTRDELSRFVGDAAAVDDTNSTGSPAPARSVFQVRRERLRATQE